MRIRTFSLLLLIFTLCLFAGGSSSAASAPGASVVTFDIGPEGAEGSIGVTLFRFRLNRTGDLSAPCSISVATREGTAFSPEDYTALSGTFSFQSGQSSMEVPVNVLGDMYAEADETFYLDITGSTGCSVQGNHFAISTINGDDPPPTNCWFLVEGDNGIDAALRVDDLVRLRRAVLGLDESLLYGCQLHRADINGDCGDGRLDAADVTVLRQWLLQGGVQRPACGPIGPPFPF